jgi:hypothetical protein
MHGLLLEMRLKDLAASERAVNQFIGQRPQGSGVWQLTVAQARLGL